MNAVCHRSSLLLPLLLPLVTAAVGRRKRRGPPSNFLQVLQREVNASQVVDDDLLVQLQMHSVLRNFQLVRVQSGRARALSPTKPLLWVYNPSILDEDNLFVKLSPFSLCHPNSTSLSAPAETMAAAFSKALLKARFVVWVQRRHLPQHSPAYRIRHVVPHAEDGRPFRVGGRVHVLFTRKAWVRGAGLVKRMWVAQLEPTFAERKLTLRNGSMNEANWLPIEADAADDEETSIFRGETSISRGEASPSIYVLYAVCPRTVLRCRIGSGACTVAFRAVGLVPCGNPLLHGGSQLVRVSDGTMNGTSWLVGVAHHKRYQPTDGGEGMHVSFYYTHVLFWLSARPPFAMLGLSPYFRLPAYFHSPLDRVQFCAGAAVDAAGEAMVLTYGVADCVSMALRLPLPTVRRLILGADRSQQVLGRSHVMLGQRLHAASQPATSGSHPLLPAGVRTGTGVHDDTAQRTLRARIDSDGRRLRRRLSLLVAPRPALTTNATAGISRRRLLSPNSLPAAHLPDADANDGSSTATRISEAPQVARHRGGSSSCEGSRMNVVEESGDEDGSRALARHFAVVIQGPLLPFTRGALQFYLSSMLPASVSPLSPAVVFAHSNGTCTTAEAVAHLRTLARAHSTSFGYVLSRPPPSAGINERNVLREAAFHGTCYAMRRWKARYVLLHRADGSFGRLSSAMASLARLVERWPPLVVAPPSTEASGRSAGAQPPTLAPASVEWEPAPPPEVLRRGRLGFCPFQTQLTSFYGPFHLDTMCVFGKAEDVLRFSSPHNPLYQRTRAASTSFEPALAAARLAGGGRRSCHTPGGESDNGALWVGWDAQQYPALLPPPLSTQALLRERAFILDPAEWSFAAIRGGKLPEGVQLRWPLDPRLFGYRSPGPEATALAPYSAIALCERRRGEGGAGLYDCDTGLPDVSNQTDTPSWPCPPAHVRCAS